MLVDRPFAPRPSKQLALMKLDGSKDGVASFSKLEVFQLKLGEVTRKISGEAHL